MTIRMLILIVLAVLQGMTGISYAAVSITSAANPNGNGLPSGGAVNDCILNTAPGIGTWQVCPGAAGGDSVTVNGAATVNPDFATTGSDVTHTNTANVITTTIKSGITITSPTLETPALGTPASGVMTNVTGTAAGLTAGTAQTGDSATSFFSAGTIEDARLPTSMADKAITGSLNIPNGAAPTTDAFGEIAGDNDAWAASRGAVQFYDGTANTLLLGTLASDFPLNGECPKWNTGGTITWETCSGGGSGTVTVVGAGSLTSTALVTGGGTTTLQTPSATATMDSSGNISTPGSIAFGTNPGDAGPVRLENNTCINWEIATPGTDKCLKVNASDQLDFNGAINLSGSTSGSITLNGATSGSLQVTLADATAQAVSLNLAAQTSGGATLTIPDRAGSNGTFAFTDGNVATATALAANGSNCSGQVALGVSASGVCEGTATPTLGTAGSVVGTLAFANATSGTITVSPPTGALGTVTLSLPAATDTLMGKATTDAMTNKTVDCTTAGNVCTIYKYMQLDLVGVAAGTAGHVWDDDPLSTTCTAASTAGTNQTRAFCTFPDSDGEYGKQLKLSLPTGYVAGSLQYRVSWKTTGTGNLRPRLQTVCYASDAASDTAYSNSTYITAAAGTSARFNQTAWTTVTDTGCDAEETMAIRFSRNRTEASDTLNATADVEFVGVRYAVAQ